MLYICGIIKRYFIMWILLVDLEFFPGKDHIGGVHLVFLDSKKKKMKMYIIFLSINIYI